MRAGKGNPRTVANVRDAARMHRAHSMERQELMRNALSFSGPDDSVLWFAEVIRSFGGRYEPFRGWSESPWVLTGRRANRSRLYALRMTVNGEKKYEGSKKTGSIRRVS